MVINYPGALSQVITNMLMNSLIHGFENDAKGNIRIEASVKNQQIYLNYSDDGVGMDQQAMRKLFDPFYTTKRGQGGSGLGAHIIYNIVTGPLGGNIETISEPGFGLTYRLVFHSTEVLTFEF